MGRDIGGRASLPERVSSAADALRSSFGFLSGVAMVAGLIAGFTLPLLDAALNADLPVFEFADRDAVRSLLQTVATTTVSVAGLAFSVTVVAFTLASSQLSPRVLRTFRSDRISQATLAVFLGTFIYCLALLLRLGSAADGQPVPNLSVTLAMLLAFVAFATFAGFIAHIVRMLQPSMLIQTIHDTGRPLIEAPYPGRLGNAPGDAAAAAREVAQRRAVAPPARVHADEAGYLATLRGQQLLTVAANADALVVQRARIGEYIVPGTLLAEIWTAREDGSDELADSVRATFELGSQRTPVQDPAFALRQLADIALKGLSPGINDPTTAENAMQAATALLVRAAMSEEPSRLRCGDDGVVRLVAHAPDLDDLVRLVFEQVRVFAAPYPVVARGLLRMLAQIDAVAGARCTEPARQAALVAEGPDGALPTAADVDGVRSSYAELWLRRGDPERVIDGP